MTIWTPAPYIRAKVLGLVWRDRELLASEVQDSSGRVYGVRPLGGAIEFGETRELALQRELEEELGCAATIVGPWHAFENIFVHEGKTGHEFIFAANVELSDRSLYEQDRIEYREDNGTSCVARWFLPDKLPSQLSLFPVGLAETAGIGV